MSKRYLIQVTAHNLDVMMRVLFGVGKPRVLQGGGGAIFTLVLGLRATLVGGIDRRYGR